MLPRNERLPTAEFARVWERGIQLRHPLLSARALRNEGDQGPARCAFVVPRKSGKAAERNRIRRRVRECFRLSAARGNGALHGHGVIFLINASRADAPLAEWARAFEELAPRIVRGTRARHAPGLEKREPDSRAGQDESGIASAETVVAARTAAGPIIRVPGRGAE